MNKPTVLVTGATGFVGRYVVRKLCEKGYSVKACARTHVADDTFSALHGVDVVPVNILDRRSLMEALKGVEIVYHFAALVSSHTTKEQLSLANLEGTKNVWECAVESGVKQALYCSSTAVYGLLAKSDQAITEDVRARAVEPYGNTKLMGETAALEIAAKSGLHTTIIRPVAIFGPGEHTPFGKQLRDAAISKLLIAGGFQNKKFNFVHVEDVAEAAIYLMQQDISSGEIYNITVNEPILFEEAFRAYIRVLDRAGSSYARIKALAMVSTLLHKVPSVIHFISNIVGERFVFRIWHPGFDLNYSSAKLMDTSFKFKWNDFEEVFNSCLNKN